MFDLRKCLPFWERNPNRGSLPSFSWGFLASNVNLAVDNLFLQSVEVLFLIGANLNVTIQRIRMSTIYFRTSRTNSNRTELLRTFARSVRNENEQNRGSVRFCSFRIMSLFCSVSNRTNRTNSNLHCSASQLWASLGKRLIRYAAVAIASAQNDLSMLA